MKCMHPGIPFGAGERSPPAEDRRPPGADGGADLLAAGLARVRAALERHAGREPDPPPPDPPPPDPDAPPDLAAAAVPQGGDLATLCRLFGLGPFERDVLLLCAGMELDAAFAPLCARAQVHPDRDYPTFGLALAALPEASWQALLPDAPLRHWQLVRLAPDAGLTEARLSIDERILHRLLGLESRDTRLAGLVEPVPVPPLPAGGAAADEAAADDDLVPSHRGVAEQLARTWRRTRGGGDFPVVELLGGDPRAKRAVAAAACARLGVHLQAMAAEALPSGAGELDALLRLWQREALLSRSVLLLAADDLRPEDPQEAAVRRFVDQSRSALVVSRQRRLPPRHRPLLSLHVERPDLEEQSGVWRRSLSSLRAAAADGEEGAAEGAAEGAEAGDEALEARVEALVDAFSLSASEIRGACVEALGRLGGGADDATADGAAVDGDGGLEAALWQTCRVRVRPALDDLAERIDARAGWDDLVLPAAQRRTLAEIVAHVRRRGVVYRRWGFGAASSRGQGVAVLFGGPSGTGKTMAAEVVARELDLDLYRIDLSSVVSKYIGETEKNLQRIFDGAEAGGAILLFDEADALFGKRSEVKDSHDRYANIEVSYLLQRMESYRGLAVLTTNLPDALDPAFRRRLRFIVQFPFPDVAQRRELWRRAFPPALPVAGLDFDRLANLNAAGGHIRNIALHAAFLAADAGRAVTMADLQAAAHGELAKIGRPLAEAETREWVV
jgi:hypothetical protein